MTETTVSVDPELPEADYHSIGKLSSSGAKVLLQEGGPAMFKWRREHPEPPKAALELGSAVHSILLGSGSDVVSVDADSWRTKAAKEEADEIRANGDIPLLAADYEILRAIVDAVGAHPLADDLLRGGQPEVSMQWDDAPTGIGLKARLDYLRPGLIVDLKTTTDASRHGFSSSAAKFGYDIQAAWYTEAVRQATTDDPAFCFVAVEKAAPYRVAVYEPDDEMRHVGDEKMRAAIDLYAECLETDTWPAYPPEVQPLTLPKWAVNEWIYS